jgi:hypothetical protein
MARIYITCPDCTADTPMQAWAMLATLDLGQFLGPLASCPGLVCAAAASSPPSARWRTCCAASRPVFPCSMTGSAAARARSTTQTAPRRPRPHAERPGAGPPFSWQDVLTLHELLETDAWIEHIAEPPQGSS